MKKEKDRKSALAYLEKQKREIQDQINKIEEEQIYEDVVPAFMEMKGKCYMYRDNSYGGGSGTWHEYYKILDSVKDKNGYVHFIIENFSTDCYGELKMVIKCEYPSHDSRYSWRDHWELIDESEYLEAKAVFMANMISLEPSRQYIKSKF